MGSGGMRTGFLVAGLFLAIVWCRPAYADDDLFPVSIQLKWYHQFQFAGYYAAMDKGYFRDAGLDVTLHEGGPHIHVSERVLSGKADFGIATSGLLSVRSRGQPVVAVAAIFQQSPFILITRDDPDIHSPADLVGKTIMVEPYSHELFTYFHHQGVDIDDINMIEHSGSPFDIFSGDIVGMTAYTTTDPYKLDKAGEDYRVFNPKDAGIDYYGDTLFTTEEFAHQHNDKVVALRKALIKGWRYALRNQEEIITLIRNDYNAAIEPDLLDFEAKRVAQLLIPGLMEIGHMNPARWQKIAEGFRSASLLQDDVDVEAFMFQADEPKNWRWLIYTLLVTALVTLVVTVALILLYNLNRKLKIENRRRVALEKKLTQQAVTDFGTGVLNRRGFLEVMEYELRRADRQGTTLSLLAFDLDHFKVINDTYGHAAGDQALTIVASTCRDTVRGIDTTGRMGGEEFMIALPDTDIEGARTLAQRFLEKLRDTPIVLADGRRFSVTASIGIICRKADEDAEHMMKRVDLAMYQAKEQGRNCISVAA